MHKDLLVRICWCCASLLLLFALAIRFAVLVAAPHSQLKDYVDFIYDDGYYYLGIAANIVDLGHSTLDGISATNGYQPAWLLILAGLARIVGTQPHTFFVASCALIYVIACTGSLLVLCWWKGPSRHVALCLGAGVAIVVVQQPGVFLEGLEPILMAPLAIPLVILLERGGDPKTLLRLSWAMAAAFLVRLDALALYFAAVIGLPLFAMLADRLTIKALIGRTLDVGLRLSVIVVPTVIAYLAINQWLFGSPVPVSGLAKLLGGAKFSNWGVVEMFFNRWHSLVLLMVILAPLEIMARLSDRRPEPLFYRSLLIVSVAVLLQCFYYAAFSAWNVWPWYAYLVAVDMALMIARIIYLSSLLYSHPRARLAALAAVLIIGTWAANRSAAFAFGSLDAQRQHQLSFLSKLGVGTARNTEVASFNQVSIAMLDKFFPADHRTLIAMGDRAGGIAYWGREKISVVQAEGLTLDIGTSGHAPRWPAKTTSQRACRSSIGSSTARSLPQCKTPPVNCCS